VSQDITKNPVLTDSVLVIIAKVEIYPDKVELVIKEFSELISKTRTEEGCLKYDLHRDLENSSVFWFYEHWENEESQKKHMNSKHLKEYLEATYGAVKSLTLNKMRLQSTK